MPNRYIIFAIFIMPPFISTWASLSYRADHPVQVWAVHAGTAGAEAAYTAADVQAVNKLIASVPVHLTRAQLNAALEAEYAGKPKKVVAALDDLYSQPWVRP